MIILPMSDMDNVPIHVITIHDKLKLNIFLIINIANNLHELVTEVKASLTMNFETNISNRGIRFDVNSQWCSFTISSHIFTGIQPVSFPLPGNCAAEICKLRANV